MLEALSDGLVQAWLEAIFHLLREALAEALLEALPLAHALPHALPQALPAGWLEPCFSSWLRPCPKPCPSAQLEAPGRQPLLQGSSEALPGDLRPCLGRGQGRSFEGLPRGVIV